MHPVRNANASPSRTVLTNLPTPLIYLSLSRARTEILHTITEGDEFLTKKIIMHSEGAMRSGGEVNQSKGSLVNYGAVG